MSMEPAATIAGMLREAETAHGAYERDVLGGKYDEEWPTWYATYLAEHGLLDQPSCAGLDVDLLAAMLRQYAADYDRDKPGNEWPDYYARRLIAAAA
jgi:hypothetical protein